jgi:hypothetical protein
MVILCDELNIVRPGFNGGWNKIMGFSSFNEAFNKLVFCVFTISCYGISMVFLPDYDYL